MQLFDLGDLEKALKEAPAIAGAFIEAKAEKEQEAYFKQSEFISRGDLLRVEARLKGLPEKDTPEFVFEGGRMFDAFFTEPAKFKADEYSDFDKLQLLKALRAFEGYKGPYYALVQEWATFVRQSLRGETKAPEGWIFQHETYRHEFAISEGIAVQAKIKSDIRVKQYNLCIDLKSTTCKTYFDFVQSLHKYSIALQGAWYKDVGKFDKFVVVGVNYQTPNALEKAMNGDAKAMEALLAPAQVFVVEFSEMTLQKERTRYQRIIKEGIQQGFFKNVTA